MQFSVNDLLNYYRCERLLFLNKYGDRKFQIPPTDFMRKLWSMGRKYEANVVDFFEYEKPKYKVGDFETGHAETLKLMEKGTEAIYQGVLKNDELIGIPDFLIKLSSGHSKFGNYFYYPVDVKSATTLKEKYLFQLACYSYLLGEIQEIAPLHGGLLLLDLDMNIKYFPAQMKKVVDAIDGSTKVLKNEDLIPDLFIDSGCPNCQWYNFCLPEAQKNNDLSLLPGIKKETKKNLKSIGINNITDFAKCTKSDFEAIKDLQGEKGETALIQAKCLSENKIYIKAKPELPTTKNELYFDLESDFSFEENGTEFSRIDYLIGVLEQSNEEFKYSHLLLEDERTFNEALINYFKAHEDFTFYHYGTYEQGVLNGKWDFLPKVKLFNIEKCLRESVIMPVTSYSLKSVAKAIGFSWSNKGSSAMQSMCWYTNYLETKDRKYLDLSIEYNEDDCRALLKMKQWLEKISNLELNTFIDI